MWNKFKLYLDKMGVIRGWGVDAVGVEGGQGGRVQLLVKGTAGHRYNLHSHVHWIIGSLKDVQRFPSRGPPHRRRRVFGPHRFRFLDHDFNNLTIKYCKLEIWAMGLGFGNGTGLGNNG